MSNQTDITAQPSPLVVALVSIVILLLLFLVGIALYYMNAQISLSQQITEQTSTLNQVILDEQDYMSRTKQISDQLISLSQAEVSDARTQIIVYKQLTPTPPVLPNGNIDVVALQNNVNSNYDKFFSGLTQQSQEAFSNATK